jgi:predicted GNAT family N-acyltransferase
MDTSVIDTEGRVGEQAAVARIAVDPVDRRSAFRLRYDVYIAEQGKGYPDANHDERLLSDELDPDSELIVVESMGDIVGTVRANWFDSVATRARYAHVFELIRFPEPLPNYIAVCSRLAASAEHRHTRARSLLFETIYANGLQRNTQLCFATCAPLLLRMFRKYGFREYLAPIHDAVVGILHRTLLVLDDLDHLERVRSPFFEMAKDRKVVPQRWSRFLRQYSRSG